VAGLPAAPGRPPIPDLLVARADRRGEGNAHGTDSATTPVPPGYAPDVSGVSATTLVIGGAIGVAAFGSLYFALAAQPGEVHARHAFAAASLVLAVAAVVAAVAAYLATHVRAGAEPRTASRPTSAAAAR
jgi:hypothetical protein